MKQSHILSDDRLIERAVNVLIDELGPVETTRFLSLPGTKRLDSVKRHQTWQAKLDKDQFFNDVFAGSQGKK